MEQLQALLVHIAVGLQRLEADLSAEHIEATSAEERARRTTLRIATAANRCPWSSVCELACYITTGALARKTHIPITIFLSRPMCMLQESRRILQLGGQMLLDAPDVELDDARALDALVFTEVASASNAAQPASSSAASSAAQPATSSAAHSVGAPSSSNSQNSVAQPVVCGSEVEDLGDNSAGGTAEDVNFEITTLTNTTSLHDVWLHRGPFSGISRLTYLHRPRRSRAASHQGSNYKRPELPERVPLR